MKIRIPEPRAASRTLPQNLRHHTKIGLALFAWVAITFLLTEYLQQALWVMTY